MPNPPGRKGLRFSIRLTVVAVFAIATTLTALVAIGLQYYFSRDLAIDTARQRYQDSAESTRRFITHLDDKAQQLTRLLAQNPSLSQGDAPAPDNLRRFSNIMEDNPLLYAIYLGFDNGDFYEVVNLNSSLIARRQLRATPQDRWLVIRVSGGGGDRQRHYDYYDADHQLRRSHAEPSDYEPRVRPWYTQANQTQVYKTPPYLFQHLQAPGQSYSLQLPGGHAVLAVDITLDAVNEFLASQSHHQGSELLLFQSDGQLIAANTRARALARIPGAAPVPLSRKQRQYLQSLGRIRVSNELDWPPLDYAVAGEPQGYSVDLLRLLARQTGLQLEFVNGYSWSQLVALFRNGELDLLQPVFANQTLDQFGLRSQPFLRLPYAIATRAGHPPLRQLDQLAGNTLAIPQSWSIIQTLGDRYPAIQILQVADPKAALEAVLEGRADGALDSAAVLRYTAEHYYLEPLEFHDLITGPDPLPDRLHFLVHPSRAPLVPILNQALDHLQSNQIAALHHKWLGSDGGKTPAPPQSTVPYSELLEPSLQPDRMQELMIGGQRYFVYLATLNTGPADERFAALIPAAQLLAPSLRRIQWSILITGLCMLVVLPFIWLFAAPIVRPIKRLAVESERIKQRRYDEVSFHDSHIVEVFELSRSISDMARTIKQHEADQRALMESLIQLIAQAIDEKSPYTAGHCARVPELALMLVDAAEQSQSPPFDRFRFASQEEYRAFRIGAWLHDCGKITTPEHIVDKGSKLETIYNRIHEIRTRFEVLWRDAEIDYLRALLESPQQEPAWRRQLEQKRTQLQQDFEFIANLNQGAEVVAAEQQQRLLEIAMLTWQRHFDDRLGLSPAEQQRVPAGTVNLPVEERLLADKPEHRVPHPQPKEFAPHLGINMAVPEQLYNLGEVYNLSVSRGTLTPEDRFKIQEHMISTIRMLDALPFPAELANVPRYAATHHETLTGSGYPRGLDAADLSIPERIMAVADIFEALTAADRPYKTAKPLSEAIAILHQRVVAGELDADVFQLFLRSGVYLDYARRFLQPEQIDAVAVEHYLDTTAS
ncbi:MAG: transporter substrate-binding domain-containing protein [Pseudomonadota bacterium]|nr:transporter substrate-binding domain-containing protein [Pseudomonadota bacterium]